MIKGFLKFSGSFSEYASNFVMGESRSSLRTQHLWTPESKQKHGATPATSQTQFFHSSLPCLSSNNCQLLSSKQAGVAEECLVY